MVDGSGVALALIDTRSPGIEITDLITTAGDAEAMVRFEGVRVRRRNPSPATGNY
jgi:hypothetical protein